MLERTAASIETCTLQKVLPSAARSPLASRRRLHTTFWSHGASGFELLDACRSFTASQFPEADKPSSDTKRSLQPTVITASTFLLDFLYPKNALAAFQRTRPALHPRAEPNLALSIPARLFSFMPRPEQESKTSDQVTPENVEGTELHQQEPVVETLRSHMEDEPDPFGIDSSVAPTKGLAGGRSALQIVEDTLASGRGKSYDLLWESYSVLGPEEKGRFRIDVAAHLLDATRERDIYKALTLFLQIHTPNWTPKAVEVGVRANLILGDVEAAFEICRKAISEHGIGLGLDHLLAHCFLDADWDAVYRVLELVSSDPRPYTTVQFTHLSKVPGLKERVEALKQRFEEEDLAPAADTLTRRLNCLFRDIAESSLPLFWPRDAGYVLEHVRDPRLFEPYILLCRKEGRGKQAGKMYRIYRELPGARPSLEILHSMINVHYPENIPALEEVMEDWYQGYGHMSAMAYHQMASAYAKHGDAKSVSHVTKEWAKYHRQDIMANSERWVASQMHVYAVQGDIKQARRVLDRMIANQVVVPSTALWNIILKAHLKANDFEGCLETFSHVCEVGSPDHYSFGTVMGMAAYRGDLSFVLELFRLATERGIKIHVEMVDCVVEAYCRNLRFEEAEDLCHTTTQKATVSGDYVHLWNTILGHYAHRRRLAKAKGILEFMTRYQIELNKVTYRHILTSLGSCLQAHDALGFLRTSVEEGLFRPEEEHYLKLMSAFVLSKEPHNVLELSNEMDEEGFPLTPARLNYIIKALTSWERIPLRVLDFMEDREKHNSRALETFYRIAKDTQFATAEMMRDITRMFSHMCFFFIREGDFMKVRELFDFFRQQFPSYLQDEELPLLLLRDVLLMDFYEGQFKHALETWEITIQQALRVAGTPQSYQEAGQLVFPALRLILSSHLKTMQRIYTAQEDPDALMALVTRVHSLGFELDSKNWNYYVQALLILQRTREAFDFCERILMPNWIGWERDRSERYSKDLRQMGNDPERPRLIYPTAQKLARQYAGLEQVALWSKESSRLYDWISENCPKTVYALSSLIASGLVREISGLGAESPDEGGYSKMTPHQSDAVDDIEVKLLDSMGQTYTGKDSEILIDERLSRKKLLFDWWPKRKSWSRDKLVQDDSFDSVEGKLSAATGYEQSGQEALLQGNPPKTKPVEPPPRSDLVQDDNVDAIKAKIMAATRFDQSDQGPPLKEYLPTTKPIEPSRPSAVRNGDLNAVEAKLLAVTGFEPPPMTRPEPSKSKKKKVRKAFRNAQSRREAGSIDPKDWDWLMSHTFNQNR